MTSKCPSVKEGVAGERRRDMTISRAWSTLVTGSPYKPNPRSNELEYCRAWSPWGEAEEVVTAGAELFFFTLLPMLLLIVLLLVAAVGFFMG
jgi:hypothetical protein